MPRPDAFANMSFHLTGQKPSTTAGQPDPETPFRVLVLGDFGGRANRGLRPVAVDYDNIDRVLAELDVALELPVAGSTGDRVEIRFGELDDFHPDQIYRRVELFQSLRETRQNLLNAETFDEAAKEVGRWTKQRDHHDPVPRDTLNRSKNNGASAAASGQNDALTHLLTRSPLTQQTKLPQAASSAAVQALLKQVVGPHVVPSASPNQDRLVDAIDTATSQQMRAVLHDPDFQALEASWRGLDFLIRNLETGQQLQVYLVDMPKRDLAGELTSGQELGSTGLYQLLVEGAIGSPSGQPWAVVVGAYTFDATQQDANLAGCIATIASHAGCPFLAQASPSLSGSASFPGPPADLNSSLEPEAKAAWEAVRRLPQASYVGLALPGFLLRLPYGESSDSIDRFEFEELEGDPGNGPCLWGNPAFVCAYLLGQEFSQHGWAFTPESDFDIEDLPAHTYTQDGESKMTPCAQVWLSDQAAQEISNQGLMVLQSIRDRDAVRLVRFQSIAAPAKNLAGRWITQDTDLQ